MSDLLHKIWQHKDNSFSLLDRAVLSMIAEEGEGDPITLDQLQRDSWLSRSTLQHSIDELVESEYLSCLSNNIYEINTEKLSSF